MRCVKQTQYGFQQAILNIFKISKKNYNFGTVNVTIIKIKMDICLDASLVTTAVPYYKTTPNQRPSFLSGQISDTQRYIVVKYY